ncbi:unnamed protein product [Caenorhabditis brenneri]
MNEKRMSYPSLRILLEHLEANKRIELVQCCPSLKHVDRAVPISIRNLYLGGSQVSINSIIYSIGVIRQYPKDGPKILKAYKRCNDSNGACYDLNQYGRLDRSGNQIVNAGEIAIPTAHNPIVERNDEEEDLHMEQEKTRLAQLKGLKRMKKRQLEIEKIEASLYEWNLRKENSHPPYSMYLQYTRVNADKTKIKERLEYNQKLHEAARYMFNVLFGGRKDPIRVDCLLISASGGVLRVPDSLKIKARKLATGYNFTPILKSIWNLLVNRSFEEISVISGTRITHIYNNQVINSAKVFRIMKTPVNGNLFQIILNSKNPHVHVSKGKITRDEYLTLFDRLRTSNRPVGTAYSFGVHSKDRLKKFFKALKQRRGVRTEYLLENELMRLRFPLCYYAFITKTKYICVSCAPTKNYNAKTRYLEPWILWFQIFQTVKFIKKGVARKKEDLVSQIDEIISTKKEIGTTECMQVQSKIVVKEMISEIQKRDGATSRKEEKRGCTRFPLTYSLPIDDSSKLVIFCSRNKDLNKKGTKPKPWNMWFFVERIDEMTSDDYKKFLDKIISDKKKIGTSYSVDLRTMSQVQELLSEVEKRDGVTCRELINRGCFLLPKTYTCPLNDTSKLTIFCVKKEDYDRKDPADRRWVLRHCIEQIDKKKVAKF